MLLKTEIYHIKTIASLLFISVLSTSYLHAQVIDCNAAQPASIKKICHSNFKSLRHDLNAHYLTAYLVTDAPTRLIDDSNKLWLNYAGQCRNTSCLKAQLNDRIEDFNFFTSMNQSLTQHYLKYENGHLAKTPVHIQIHQLSKDRIKIEGLAYRDPNRKTDAQTESLLAYTTPDKKNEILDNEHQCKYQLNFQKAILEIKTQQKGCDRFTGVYRLYD